MKILVIFNYFTNEVCVYKNMLTFQFQDDKYHNLNNFYISIERNEVFNTCVIT